MMPINRTTLTADNFDTARFQTPNGMRRVDPERSRGKSTINHRVDCWARIDFNTRRTDSGLSQVANQLQHDLASIAKGATQARREPRGGCITQGPVTTLQVVWRCGSPFSCADRKQPLISEGSRVLAKSIQHEGVVTNSITRCSS